jgi:uncharacterized protein (DUF2062 family)
MKTLCKYKLADIKQVLKNLFFNSNESNMRIAVSVAIGIFTSIIPIWGFQTLLAILLAFILRLNKIITIAVSNISQPPVTPIIIFVSYLLGGLFLNNDHVMYHYSTQIDFGFISRHFYQYIIGSVILAAILAPLLGIITFIFLNKFRLNRQ